MRSDPVPDQTPAGDLDDQQTRLNRSHVLQLYRRFVNSGFAKLADVMGLPMESRSAGSLVFDEADNAYLDCGGYGVFLLGHRHPRVVEAVKAQIDRHPLATRTMLSPEMAIAAASLARVAPGDLQFVCFTNSGAESTELGLKIARLNGKHRVIAMTGGFHGKTLGALSVMGQPRYQTPFTPLLQDVEWVPFGDAPALEHALSEHRGEASVILEPVQGERGVIVPPSGYLADVQRLCRTFGALLILDEIQTGLGRLGAWWGADYEHVRPDVLLVGKGLSGGVVPIGAVVATTAVFEGFNRDPLLHTSTFGGSPLATAAAHAAILTIEREGLVARASEVGRTMLEALRGILQNTCPTLVREVRGVGLLIGIEFIAEHVAGDFMFKLLEKHVVVCHSLNAHRVIRLTPPAIITESECRWLFDAAADAASELRTAWA